MLKRKLNYRPTWNLNLAEPIAGNYYPVTSKISLVDKYSQKRFSALIDRSEGGTSLTNGEIELMVFLKQHIKFTYLKFPLFKVLFQIIT